MESYPSIPGPNRSAFLGRPCYGFMKYDGSNLRWEWTKKRGFFKFGTRTRLFDQSDIQFGDAIKIFFDKYYEPLEQIIIKEFDKSEKVTVFTEYFGSNSFAGSHEDNDIKELRLIDVQVYKKGILSPKDFLKIFGDLPFCAELIYEGNFNKELINQVRNGELGSNEGIICKGGTGHSLWMAKIKKLSYIEKLKSTFGSNWGKFGE